MAYGRGTEAVHQMQEEHWGNDQDDWENDEFDEQVSASWSRVNESSYAPSVHNAAQDRYEDEDYQQHQQNYQG